jgi:peroxiredoxin family protein
VAKLSVILASEKLDKVYPALNIALVASISGWDVDVFFTFWGLLLLKKGYMPSGVSTDYREYQDRLTKAITDGLIPNWKDIIEKAKDTGRVKIYACSTTMNLLGVGKEELEIFVDGIVGASYLLGRIKESDATLFIS